jgi:hypothetical protein
MAVMSVMTVMPVMVLCLGITGSKKDCYACYVHNLQLAKELGKWFIGHNRHNKHNSITGT